MKFLDSTPELDLLAHALNFHGPGVKVASRVEAYTIKPLARDRAVFKRLDAELLQADAGSPISPPLAPTALAPSADDLGGRSEGRRGYGTDGEGGLSERSENRKTLWLLIGILNLAFADHDFSDLTADDFVREPSSRVVLAQLSTALGHLRQTGSAFVGSSSPPKYSTSLSSISSSAGTASLSPEEITGPAHPILRQVLDPIIDLDDCEVYSYAPDFESDPHNGDTDSEEDVDDSSDDEEAGSKGDAGSDVEDDLAWPLEGVPRSTPRLPRRRVGLRLASANSPLTGVGAAKRSLSMLSLNESTGGLLWSSNYFFLNRKKKRLLFVSLWARAAEGGIFAASGAVGPPVPLEPPTKRIRCAV